MSDFETINLTGATSRGESVSEEIGPHVYKLIPEGEVIEFRTEQNSDLGLGPCSTEVLKAKSDYAKYKDTGVLYHRARYRDQTHPQGMAPACQRTRVMVLHMNGQDTGLIRKLLKS